MYDSHMAHITFRSAISSAIRSARRTDHQGTQAKKGDLTTDTDIEAEGMVRWLLNAIYLEGRTHSDYEYNYSFRCMLIT